MWLTADGVPVLDHDGVVRVRARKRRIAELRRAELPGHLPTVADLLTECGTDFELSLDLKDRAVVQPLSPRYATFARQRSSTGCGCATTISRCWCPCGRPRPPDSSTRPGSHASPKGPERRAATLRDLGVDALNMHHTDWTGGLTVLLHRFDRYAFGWDVQQPRHLTQALRMGLDGIYSDHVDRMHDAYRAEIGEA